MTDQSNVFHIDTCPTCRGIGWTVDDVEFVVLVPDRITEPYPPILCPTCDGRGRIGLEAVADD